MRGVDTAKPDMSLRWSEEGVRVAALLQICRCSAARKLEDGIGGLRIEVRGQEKKFKITNHKSQIHLGECLRHNNQY